MFQPEKSDFQLGTRQWKFTKFQKGKKIKIKLPDFCSRFQEGSPEYIMLFFFFFSFFFGSQIWLNLLMDAYL
jgi:hypothetical protein